MIFLFFHWFSQATHYVPVIIIWLIIALYVLAICRAGRDD